MNERQHVKKIEKEFDYIDAKVAEANAELEHMPSEVKDRYSREVEGLKARADRLRTEFRETKEAASGLLPELINKYHDGLEDLKKAFKNMRDRMS